MAARSRAPNIVLALRIAADNENKAKNHRKSLQCNIASAIALMAVIDIVAPLAVVIVPKADSAPISVTKIVRQAVVIDVATHAILHPLAGTKYSSGATKNNIKR